MKGIDHFSRFRGGGERGIAKKAHDFRVRLGVSDKTYVNIVEILEFQIPDIIPEFRLMVRRDSELDSLAYTTIDPPRIFVRETVYDGACTGDARCREILAHELGHFLLHEKITTRRMQENAEGHVGQFSVQNLNESSEAQANVFLRNFLVPSYIAIQYRNDFHALAVATGTTAPVAAAAITVSKRAEMFDLTKNSVHQIAPRTGQA